MFLQNHKTMDNDNNNNDNGNTGRDKVDQQETHEVFGDVNLMGAMVILFLLQLMQYIMNKRYCTC